MSSFATAGRETFKCNSSCKRHGPTAALSFIITDIIASGKKESKKREYVIAIFLILIYFVLPLIDPVAEVTKYVASLFLPNDRQGAQ